MNYQKTIWKDEILSGNKVLFDIYKDGNIYQANIELILKNGITQAGTAVNAVRLNNIEDELQFLTEKNTLTEFLQDGSIKETNDIGFVRETTFLTDRVLEKIYKNNILLYTKSTIFNSNNTIREEIT